MEEYKARWLVDAWYNATDEAKADRRQYGPMTREVTAQAFENLGLEVPPELLIEIPTVGLSVQIPIKRS